MTEHKMRRSSEFRTQKVLTADLEIRGERDTGELCRRRLKRYINRVTKQRGGDNKQLSVLPSMFGIYYGDMPL